MIVVILAGGRGTRLGGDQPKPMVEIGGKPMLSHIMGIYKKFGYNDFIIATGYKGEMIREYYEGDPRVICFDTGLDTGDGERVRMCAKCFENEDFLLTYGDGVANIDIKALIKKHNSNDAAVTMTVVNPPARFGQPVLDDDDYVTEFNEKPVNRTDLINGGFFVVTSIFARSITGKMWAYDVLPKLAERRLLRAYRHTGFWQCMDTQRDVDYLNQLVQEGRAAWL